MNTFLFCFKLFPTLLAGIAAVNEVVRGLPGEGKLTVLLAGVKAAAKAAESAPESHVDAAALMVEHIVDGLNQSGAFAHAGKPSVIPVTGKSETTPILDVQANVVAARPS